MPGVWGSQCLITDYIHYNLTSVFFLINTKWVYGVQFEDLSIYLHISRSLVWSYIKDWFSFISFLIKQVSFFFLHYPWPDIKYNSTWSKGAFPFYRLYFLNGVQISDVDQIIQNGQYVACKRMEKFKRARYNEQATKNLSTSPRLERKL